MSPKAGPSNTWNERLKVVVRRLPSDLPESIFWSSISPWVVPPAGAVVPLEEKRRGERVSWGVFLPGKVRQNGKDKEDVHSRAYLTFSTLEHLIIFHNAYNGWSFRSKTGAIMHAVIEFAPYQRTPMMTSKLDPRLGTIEEDPDYQAFLLALSTPEPIEKLDESLQIKKGPQSTPLLDHLRAQKVTEMKNRKNLKSFATLGSSTMGKRGVKPSGMDKLKVATTGSKGGVKAGKGEKGKGKQESGKGPSRGGGSVVRGARGGTSVRGSRAGVGQQTNSSDRPPNMASLPNFPPILPSHPVIITPQPFQVLSPPPPPPPQIPSPKQMTILTKPVGPSPVMGSGGTKSGGGGTMEANAQRRQLGAALGAALGGRIPKRGGGSGGSTPAERVTNEGTTPRGNGRGRGRGGRGGSTTTGPASVGQ